MMLSRKVEIQPTPTQARALLQHAGNARWAYNWGLAKRNESYKRWVDAGRPKKWTWPTAISLHKELNVLKKTPIEDGGVPWMYEASKCAPQESLRDLDVAFKNMFRRMKQGGKIGYPRFKSRSKGIGGFRLSGAVRSNEKTFNLPRIGRVRIKPGDHGYIPVGKHSQVSVTESAGRWFVSVLVSETEYAAPNGKPEVGLDMGVIRLATLSDGLVIENPRALSRNKRSLKKRQRDLSRKEKGSANRRKARRKLARAHRRVRNVRADSLHKASTMLTKSHGRICIENLKISNMTRNGGCHKRGLNRVMLDASLGEFRRQLEYKGRLYGCEIIAVPPAYTSQRCSSCGHTEKENRKTQSEFVCLSCGHEMNADLNAAINIYVAGSCPETQNACGEDVSLGQPMLSKQTSMKQESAVAT